MDAHNLAHFLRTRRERLTPSETWMSPTLRRRTPGLRREEVAQMAGISTDYYTRLEQRRAPQPSLAVLKSLTRALRLTLDERDHLYRLAGHNVPDRTRSDDHVSPILLSVVDRLHDIPAQVMTDLGETIAQNQLARSVFGDHRELTGMARNVVYQWFTTPRARTAYPPQLQVEESRILVADLRAAHARRNDAKARDLVGRLRAESPEFAALWDDHEVAVLRSRRKRVAHPEVGLLELDCQALLDDDRSQVLALFTPTPGTPTAEKLTLLSAIGSPHPSV
ncbi:helix-turn-helix transcriptional regulator [Planotetraspora phitsanulokensis]|uniref:DNA-binding protein n=1 Tax=Planotetraspora phitsanulokensis TaxID=575192 RepID=A0A8J3XND2_9ACTN|nr:helix-turn-helix transcriptional regulator [Planotetraspora phitsanulokensis]GII42693.1 DNA-binding protein [Planotetraspora phitsanulokensis]